MAIIKGAEPFLLKGNNKGVLLIHGFTGSPSEMRLIGQHLHKIGFTVFGVRLSGHGTTPQEMSTTGWVDWFRSVEDGYHILKSLCKNICAVGLSMGGLLALKLSLEYPLEKVVAMNTPIFSNEPWMNTSLISEFLGNHHDSEKEIILDPIAAQYSIGYDCTPKASLNSLKDFIHHMEIRLANVNTPVMIMQSKSDEAVRPESAQYIYDHIGGHEKGIIWYEDMEHNMLLSAKRSEIYKDVGEFLGE